MSIMDATEHVWRGGMTPPRGPWRSLLSGGGEDAPFSFEDILYMMITMISIWASGKVMKALGAPPLVGEIIMGIIVGPNLTDFAPKPEALQLCGEVGLLLLVLEAGLDVDIAMIKKMGLRAAAVAVSGSLVPLGIATGIGIAIGMEWKPALVCGVVLSPTSVGIALNVLNSAKILQTEMGQLIIAAAILDDIIALILLSELEALDDPNAWAFIKPLLVSFLLLFGIGAIAVLVVPRALQFVLPKIAEHQRENFILLLIFCTAIGMIPAVHYSGGSHLLGSFLAGLCFCSDPHVHHAWIKQVKRVMHWLLTIFFSCTIGFVIPIKQLFTAKVVSRAAALFVAILGKVLTGFWSPLLTTTNFFTIGFSMSAWGEFAFVVASAAQSQHLIDDDTFSACILCVLLSVIFGPIFLRITVGFIRPETDEEEVSQAGDGKEVGSVYFLLSVKCQGRPGQLARVDKALEQLKLELIDTRAFHVKGSEGALAFKDSGNGLVADVIVKDSSIMLPMVLTEEEEKEAYWQRHAAVQSGMRAAVKDVDADVEVLRWLPGLIEGSLVNGSDSETSARGSMSIEPPPVLRALPKKVDSTAPLVPKGNGRQSIDMMAGSAVVPSSDSNPRRSGDTGEAKSGLRRSMELVGMSYRASMEGMRKLNADGQASSEFKPQIRSSMEMCGYKPKKDSVLPGGIPDNLLPLSTYGGKVIVKEVDMAVVYTHADVELRRRVAQHAGEGHSLSNEITRQMFFTRRGLALSPLQSLEGEEAVDLDAETSRKEVEMSSQVATQKSEGLQAAVGHVDVVVENSSAGSSER